MTDIPGVPIPSHSRHPGLPYPHPVRLSEVEAHPLHLPYSYPAGSRSTSTPHHPITPMCLGIPGQITTITDPINQLATVDIGGVRRAVNIACIVDDDHPIDTCVGEWVLVHVGFALNRLDPDEAAATLSLLDQIAALG